MNILIIKGNPKPLDESTSLQLLEKFKKGLLTTNVKVNITEIDLYKSPPPFYDYNTFRYYWYPVGIPDYEPNQNEKKAVLYAKEQIKLLNDADILVIVCPMWNFSFPSIVKAWIDQILMPKDTFFWTEIGQTIVNHKIKKAILLSSASDEYYLNDPKDHLTSLFNVIFSFILVQKTSVIFADRQNPIFFQDQEEVKEKSLIDAYNLGESIGKGVI